jgi:aminoglycoside/choline kinase family phosphotransferase
MVQAVSELLLRNAAEQPQVLTHRDFHSRNLMWDASGLHIIDFQDTVIGPITYDPVSLLKDCYIRWPIDRVRGWALEFREEAIQRGRLAPVSEAKWLRWFDLMGLQRHLKVLGIFARLCHRDGKTGYLRDLPLTLQYCREVAASYPELHGFAQWLTRDIAPRLEAGSQFR